MAAPFSTDKVFINGVWRSAADGATLLIENPSTGEVMGALVAGTAADVDAAVRAARAAFDGDWGRMTAVERGRILARMGREVEARIDMLAELEALDVGKPLKQARNDVIALARYLEFYAGAA
ncbi:MAG TPA: aldehyde dehydrogenase, partial [Brevundimonas sp.]|nr:aldehyde dehydrogenase [Brevundimonas sp.]